jgi:hypothetical protein
MPTISSEATVVGDQPRFTLSRRGCHSRSGRILRDESSE